MNLNHIDLDEFKWAQSLFGRMKFLRRFNTTDKVPIPEALRKELEKGYLHSIVRKIEENNIPLSLVLNLDQTPPKYIPVSRNSLIRDRPINLWSQLHFPLPLTDIFCPCSLSMQAKQRNASQESSFLHPFYLASTKRTTAI